MNNNTTTDQKAILLRIKKLLKHAESARALGSLAEAEAFAMKANELLAEHNLQTFQALDQEDDDSLLRNMGWSERLSYKDNQSGNAWRIDLVRVLTNYNFCSFTFNRYSHTFQLYGKMENVDTVVWMYHFLSTGLLRLAQETHVNLSPEIKAMYNRYSFLKDFLLGAVRGIQQQLKAQREKQASQSMTALIVYNDKALDAFIKKTKPHIKERSATKTKVVGEGYSIGYDKGLQYNITRPLASGTSQKQSKTIAS